MEKTQTKNGKERQNNKVKIKEERCIRCGLVVSDKEIANYSIKAEPICKTCVKLMFDEIGHRGYDNSNEAD